VIKNNRGYKFKKRRKKMTEQNEIYETDPEWEEIVDMKYF